MHLLLLLQSRLGWAAGLLHGKKEKHVEDLRVTLGL